MLIPHTELILKVTPQTLILYMASSSPAANLATCVAVVNRGEEKVSANMNVVPRSTMNTNGGTEN